eukprot:6197199-Pleurochrysis_carterae.AAC.2
MDASLLCFSGAMASGNGALAQKLPCGRAATLVFVQSRRHPSLRRGPVRDASAAGQRPPDHPRVGVTAALPAWWRGVMALGVTRGARAARRHRRGGNGLAGTRTPSRFASHHHAMWWTRASFVQKDGIRH